MPAEIKAKLELITGGTPATAGGAPAMGGAIASAKKEDTIMKNVGNRLDALTRVLDRRLESFTDIKNSMKDMVAIFRKPGAVSKGGLLSSVAEIGELIVSGVVAFFAGYGAAALGDKIGTAIGTWAANAVDAYLSSPLVLPFLNMMGIYSNKQEIPIQTLPASNPDIRTGKGELGEYWEIINAVDTIKMIQERINELQEDGIQFNEVIEFNQLKQAEALYNQLATQKDLSSEEEMQIQLQIDKLNYVQELINGAGDRLNAEKAVTSELQKQKEVYNSMKKTGTTASGADEYTAQIGEYEYTGKINVIPGKFIGVRTVR